ncbi:hypothetical protein C2S51_015217 [Perilla frutescens var. frutescens]|nr:hypothetical protein C2S51_015217 [Perilla frutescens var. frutescens]
MSRKFSAANSSKDGVSDSSGDRDNVFGKSRKVKVIDVDSEPYGSCSTTQGSQGLEVFEISDGDFQKSKKMKKADFDPFEYNSSEELEGIVVPPKRKGGEIGDFDFSEDGDLWKSKKLKKADFHPFECNLSEELEGIVVPPQRKGREIGVFDSSEDGDLWKSKKPKEDNFDPFEYNSSEELEGIAVQPQRKGREIGVFDFSEDEDLWKPKKCKNGGSDASGINSSQELRDLRIPQSRKHGWNELSMGLTGVSVKSKKKIKGRNGALEKKKKKKRESRDSDPGYIELTDTLMETQESGETTEHADEANFALNGLKKGQPVRVRRASLISLLSICGTLQQRRLLRAQGIARKIIDAILGLSFDDTPSNLAAAALFYLLTSDGQDEHLLYSPSSMRFLIKLLKPLSSAAAKEKSQPIGSKLLGLCKNPGYSQDLAKETDSTSTQIMLKVREILVNCKEMKPIDDSDGVKQEPELNPKWISLLTIEKACSSSISIEGLEEISRTSRRTGATFKVKLRESGGLDAVFEVARKCHSVMEDWLEKSPSFALDSKNISGLESLMLLLKCLKIMENATFLSNDNQCHLLGMKGSFGGQQAPRSFTKLILSVIKILSGVSLLRHSLMSSQDEKLGSVSYGSSLSGGHCSMERTSYESLNQCDPCLISGQPRSSHSSVEATQVSLQKWRFDSSQAGLCSGTSCSSNNTTHVNRDDSGVEFGTRNGKLMFTNSGITEDSSDPFGFDEDDFEASKWKSLSGTRSINKYLSLDGSAAVSGYTDTSNFVPLSQQESNNVEYDHSQETSCSSAVDEDMSNLLADCLLTAIKVLMNLSNDNPEGCRQIASSGGLEILSSLIAGHFPSFSLPLPRSHHVRDGSLSSKSSLTISQRSNTPLSDQDLDFLVAILGLLVNLVEKDGGNRSRLAEASVSPPNLVGLDLKEQNNVIPILCSIFLANLGTSEAAGEEKCLSWEDEDSILQGEKEAEKMIVEAYAALLLAFLSTESKRVRNTIAKSLPDHNLKILVPVLERFVEFHKSLNVFSQETHSAVLEVIESCRIP